jgi:hypothetical protein
VVLDPVLEQAIFLARARQHRQKPAALAVDVAQVLEGAQLRIGDVEKPGRPDPAAQRLPGLAVRGAVLGGSIGDLEVHGHRAVGADREDP